MADKGEVKNYGVTYPSPARVVTLTSNPPMGFLRAAVLTGDSLVPCPDSGSTPPTTGQLWPRGMP